MKKIIAYAVSFLFLFQAYPSGVYSQSTDDPPSDAGGQTPAQTEEEKKAAEAAEKEAKMLEYGEKKADLELQLATLARDRKIASRDKNKDLENKRASEIKETRNQLKNLNKEYGIDDDKEDEGAVKAEKKKAEPKLDMNALQKELAREMAKMEGREYKDENPGPAPVKKPAVKKKSKKK
jgi:hypothetical protein